MHRSLDTVDTPYLGEISRLSSVIDNGVAWLRQNQAEEGYWVGMLESNACMEAEWILAMHFLGITDDPKYDKVVRAILNQQCEDGSWQVYHGASGGDINTTVECYAALRVSGLDPDCKIMQRAREWIFAHGGLANIRNFTKYWLALIGEWPWQATPMLSPEMILLPKWLPFNIYQFASWARGTMVPLSILSARRPVRPLPPERRLDELFPQGRDHQDYHLKRRHPWWSWEGPFYLIDRFLRYYGELPYKPVRETAIKQCLEWIIKHQDADGAWSGIQPPWIYSLMALHVEGYPLKHPVLRAGLEAFNTHWSYERDGAVYLQASESPVWDTGLTLLAMLDCGYSARDERSMQKAVQWLLDKQVTLEGDWKVYVQEADPGGWAFQRENGFYPDVDDTAVILMILKYLQAQLPQEKRAIDDAIKRATQWILAMQCSNGGWAAFDRDNIHPWLTRIPFCDFGELLDPPSVDVTAHVVEALALHGWTRDDPVIRKALQFIRSEQEEDGSWFGRWGVNHIYGIGAVLPALKAIGIDMSETWVRQSGDWIIEHQNEDGGWGETCASYMDDKLRGIGPSTASQTGWALMALIAVDCHEYHDAIERGIEFLVRTHKQGTWEEPEYTGTGFPGYGVGQRIDLQREAEYLGQGVELERAFMINYNMYRHYFPLMALGRARAWLTSQATVQNEYAN